MSSKEVIFVQGKIPPNSPLSPSVFRTWYEEVHIPDLLRTPGIATVFRYIAANTPTDEKQAPGFPYLAVYPQVDRAWLHSDTCEFLKVPLHSDILPPPNKFIFDVAEFAMGVYEEAAAAEDGAFDGPPKHLVVVPVDEKDVESQGPERVLHASLSGGNGPVRSTLLRYDFSPSKRPPRTAEIAEGKMFVGTSYVAFHQLNQVPAATSEPGAVVYNLVSAFGDVNVRV